MKSGDLLRQFPHTLHSLLAKADDPVVRESYRRTGTLTPAQVHSKWFDWLKNNPNGEFLFIVLYTKPITLFNGLDWSSGASLDR